MVSLWPKKKEKGCEQTTDACLLRSRVDGVCIVRGGSHAGSDELTREAGDGPQRARICPARFILSARNSACQREGGWIRQDRRVAARSRGRATKDATWKHRVGIHRVSVDTGAIAALRSDGANQRPRRCRALTLRVVGGDGGGCLRLFSHAEGRRCGADQVADGGVPL